MDAELNIGDVIRIGRTNYTIMAKFLGANPGKTTENDTLYVGRKEISGGGYSWYSYSNIIYCDSKSKQFRLRT